jgi:hypothetical protein
MSKNKKTGVKFEAPDTDIDLSEYVDLEKLSVCYYFNL